MRDATRQQTDKAVLRAIETMRARLGEQLTVDDLAHAAIFSKFHFSRVFHRTTGLPPGRFLSALRLQEAKRLLRATALPVTEISIRVGYSSVGTFSSRFKAGAGLSPTEYRRLGGLPAVPAAGARGGATVRGGIGFPVWDRPVFAGLFRDRIIEGRPASSMVLRRPGPYVLRNVPLGSWHLIAVTGERDGYVGSCGPIVIRSPTDDHLADVRLGPACPLDPPVLLALGELLSPLRNTGDVAAVSAR